MKRREFMTLVGGAAAYPLTARAQQTVVPVVGFLNAATATGRANFVAAFSRGLGEAGFVEGRNVVIEYRWANDQYDRLPALAADLVHRKVDVIVAIGTAAPGLAAKAATSTIPIVFQTGGDPVKAGLVGSLNRPDRNITGTVIFATGLESKRLGLLHEMVTRGAPIAVLLNRNSPAAEGQRSDVQSAAQALDRQIHVLSAASEDDIDLAFKTILQEKTGGLLVCGDPFLSSRRQQIVALAARHRITAVYERREFVEAGGLASYGTSISDGYRQTGIYAGRILKGEKPSDLPVLQSAKFDLVINVATAKAQGIDLPHKILALADDVIE
jgi:putative ABC transport system substrate-binding protein